MPAWDGKRLIGGRTHSRNGITCVVEEAWKRENDPRNPRSRTLGEVVGRIPDSHGTTSICGWPSVRGWVAETTVLFRPTLHAKWRVTPSKRWGTLQNREGRVTRQKKFVSSTPKISFFGVIEPPRGRFFSVPLFRRGWDAWRPRNLFSSRVSVTRDEKSRSDQYSTSASALAHS